MKRFLLFLAFLCLLVGAAHAEDKPKFVVHDDKFSTVMTVVGPYQKTGFGFFDNGGMVWYLRSFVGKKDHVVAHQIYATIMYSGDDWAFFERAADDHAEPLKLDSIDRKVVSCVGGIVGCIYQEIVGVTVTEDELRARPEGFQVQVVGKSGLARVLDISPDQIQTQLDAVNQQAQAVAAAN